MIQFCLSKKHVGSITTYQNHVSTLCGWLEKMLPLRTLFFHPMKMCRYVSFIFLEEHVVISPAFASPTFLIIFDQLSTQQCQSWHQCMVRESDHSGFSFSSLCFGSSPEKAGPPGPACETLLGCHGGFSPRNFGIWGPNSGDMNGTCKKWFFIRVFNCFLTSFRLFFCVVRQVIDLTMFSGRTKEQSGIPVCRQNLWHWETVVVD